MAEPGWLGHLFCGVGCISSRFCVEGVSALRFTYSDYAALLARLQEAGYVSAAFEDAESLLAAGGPFVLLRHDIDFDLGAALEMARIEAEAGIFSTWFPFLRTECYNIFSAVGSKCISEMLAMGHRLGLHFDCTLYPGASAEALSRACDREARMLEEWFGIKVEVVSFHRPLPVLVGASQALTAPRLHTYQPLFIHYIHYLADSRGLWRFGEPLDSRAFAERAPLHLLVHPIWWRDHVMPAARTLHDFIDRRSLQLEAAVAANSTVYTARKYD